MKMNQGIMKEKIMTLSESFDTATAITTTTIGD